MSNEERVIEPMPEQKVDPLLYRIIIGGLVAALILIIIGTVILALQQAPLPDLLTMIAGVIVGALAGVVTVSKG